MLKNKNNKRGYTLVELVVVIMVIAILIGVSIGVGTKQVKNARIQETTSFLQTVASNVEEWVMDTGFLRFDPGTGTELKDHDESKNVILGAIRELSDKYLSCDVNVSTINYELKDADFIGFSVQLSMALDAWNNPYTLYYMTDYPAAKAANREEKYFIAIGSKGPNTFSDPDGAEKYGYHDAGTHGGFDDDIVVIMESR